MSSNIFLHQDYLNYKSQLKEMEDRIKSLEGRVNKLASSSFVATIIQGVGFVLASQDRLKELLPFMFIGVFPILVFSQLLLLLAHVRSPNLFPSQIEPLAIPDDKKLELMNMFRGFYEKYMGLWNYKTRLSRYGATLLITFLISGSAALYFVIFAGSFITEIWFAFFWLTASLLLAVILRAIFDSKIISV